MLEHNNKENANDLYIERKIMSFSLENEENSESKYSTPDFSYYSISSSASSSQPSRLSKFVFSVTSTLKWRSYILKKKKKVNFLKFLIMVHVVNFSYFRKVNVMWSFQQRILSSCWRILISLRKKYKNGSGNS